MKLERRNDSEDGKGVLWEEKQEKATKDKEKTMKD